ncbi:MAG: DUF4241 domain-containing protein [Oscillospiraceae bacterium]|nr:DUF4241 domain-containing protein [Oscillospiraceae bacterium]
MNTKQAEVAINDLAEWLVDSEILDKSPVAVECTGDFEKDGLTYYILKYQKRKFGKWYIGVCGGFEGDSEEHCGHVFSGGEDLYEEENAQDLAWHMAEFIKGYIERQAFQSVAQDAFKENLEYISQTEVDPEKIDAQFVRNETRFYLPIGTADIPSGRVVVADPLCYMAGSEATAPVLKREIPAGSYPVDVAICRSEMVGIRMCTARLKIKPTKAVRYELAEPTHETAAYQASDGDVTGFPVDAGMMCFCDAEGAKDYANFIMNWHEDNPDGNHYDDYFAAFFAESEKELPAYQRDGGDFIEWKNPDNGQRIVMISSGMGDGFYQCFWGIDDSGEICELICPMVDPELFGA